MLFLIRPKPFEYESLSSYIHRIAESNYTSPHEVWRLLLSPICKYPDSSISYTIDASPDSVFNIKEFSKMLQFEEDMIYSLTFVEVLRKLGIKELTRTRATKNLFKKSRSYCADCLNENNIYKLIWQVKEIFFCNIHGKYLSSSCSSCHKEIKILPNSPIGICPYCNFELKYNTSIDYNLNEKDIVTLKDWQYLLDRNNIGINQIDGFPIEQTIGIKIMYIVEMLKDQSFASNEINHIKRIKQIARGSLNTLHLNTITYWTRKAGISIKDFINLEVPFNYIIALLDKRKKLSEELYCISPWCNSFKKVGSLNKTSTAQHTRKNGEVSNYYLYCKDCGIEYSYDFKNSKIVERNYFISLAWNKIRNILELNLSLKDMASNLGESIDRVSRSIIFLVANNLIDRKYITLKIPYNHNTEILDQVKSLINQNFTLKEIKEKLNLTKNEILFYWFKSEIKICYIEKNFSYPKSSNEIKYTESKYYEKVLLALEHFDINGITITLKGISQYLNLCTSTLRDSGLTELVKQAKVNQKLKIEKANNVSYLKLATQIINEMVANNEDILSNNVYERIGIRRTVLVRKYPEVTKKINELIIAGKAKSNF